MIVNIKNCILQGRLDEARSKCLEMLEDKTSLSNKNYIFERAEIYELLGDISQQKNNLNETITYYLNALNLNANDHVWIKFANSIKYAQFNTYHAQIEQAMIKGLSKSFVASQHFAFPGISLLKISPSFGATFELLSAKNLSQAIEKKLYALSFNTLENPLLLKLAEKTILSDPELEKLLTYTRSSLLKIVNRQTETQITDRYGPFINALAMQCFHNEYVYCETEEERVFIDQLIASLSHVDLAKDLTASVKTLITLLACYRPLYTLPIATKLAKLKSETYSDPFQNLIKNQIQEPLIEEHLNTKIPSLNPIADEISIKVRDQYEENPYPRWTNVDKKTLKSIQNILTEKFPLNSIGNHFSASPEILIAGCGTGQHAINCANSYKDSKLLAVDLSKRSLAYAAKKANEFELSNIDFLQADILDLRQLHRTFDVIECVGVLHHMHDPLKGWEILTSLLKPKGLMVIGLYSQLARQDIHAARFLIKKHGYQPTLEGIRECRQHIFRLPSNDSLRQLSLGVDFYTTSSCRDLLFHVQEHQFTLPQIQKDLKQLGLSFLGFELKNPETLEKYLAEFPNDPEARSLENWNIFEQKNPDTFVGMYCLWLHKEKQPVI